MESDHVINLKAVVSPVNSLVIIVISIDLIDISDRSIAIGLLEGYITVVICCYIVLFSVGRCRYSV